MSTKVRRTISPNIENAVHLATVQIHCFPSRCPVLNFSRSKVHSSSQTHAMASPPLFIGNCCQILDRHSCSTSTRDATSVRLAGGRRSDASTRIRRLRVAGNRHVAHISPYCADEGAGWKATADLHACDVGLHFSAHVVLEWVGDIDFQAACLDHLGVVVQLQIAGLQLRKRTARSQKRSSGFCGHPLVACQCRRCRDNRR